MYVQSIVYFVVIALLVACTEFRTVDRVEGENIPFDIAVGDNVLVVTEDGSHHEFEVKQLTDKSIVGDQIKINYEDVKLIRKEQIDKSDTALSTSGILLGAAIVAVIIYFLSNFNPSISGS